MSNGKRAAEEKFDPDVFEDVKLLEVWDMFPYSDYPFGVNNNPKYKFRQENSQQVIVGWDENEYRLRVDNYKKKPNTHYVAFATSGKEFGFQVPSDKVIDFIEEGALKVRVDYMKKLATKMWVTKYPEPLDPVLKNVWDLFPQSKFPCGSDSWISHKYMIGDGFVVRSLDLEIRSLHVCAHDDGRYHVIVGYLAKKPFETSASIYEHLYECAADKIVGFVDEILIKKSSVCIGDYVLSDMPLK